MQTHMAISQSGNSFIELITTFTADSSLIHQTEEEW